MEIRRASPHSIHGGPRDSTCCVWNALSRLRGEGARQPRLRLVLRSIWPCYLLFSHGVSLWLAAWYSSLIFHWNRSSIFTLILSWSKAIFHLLNICWKRDRRADTVGARLRSNRQQSRRDRLFTRGCHKTRQMTAGQTHRWLMRHCKGYKSSGPGRASAVSEDPLETAVLVQGMS